MPNKTTRRPVRRPTLFEKLLHEAALDHPDLSEQELGDVIIRRFSNYYSNVERLFFEVQHERVAYERQHAR